MKVIMQFSGHDIEGDAATLATINDKLTQNMLLVNVLHRAVAPYSASTRSGFIPTWVLEARRLLADA